MERKMKREEEGQWCWVGEYPMVSPKRTGVQIRGGGNPVLPWGNCGRNTCWASLLGHGWMNAEFQGVVGSLGTEETWWWWWQPHPRHQETIPSPWPMDEEGRVCPSDQRGGLWMVLDQQGSNLTLEPQVWLSGPACSSCPGITGNDNPPCFSSGLGPATGGEQCHHDSKSRSVLALSPLGLEEEEEVWNAYTGTGWSSMSGCCPGTRWVQAVVAQRIQWARQH